MPSNDGVLTRAEQEKISAHLNEKGKNHNCPVCGENNWTIGEHLLNGMVHTPGSMRIGGPTYPMAFVVCRNCSYLRQFMAVPLGLGANLEDGSDGG